MKRYEEQLNKMLVFLGIGYGVGVIAAFVLSWLSYKEICSDFFMMGIVLWILIGSAISMIIISTRGIQNAAVNASVGIIRSMFGGLFTAGIGSGLLLFIFILKIMAYLMITLVLALFMIVSFPLTIIYTVVMYFMEKSGKEISDDTADTLDKIVPVAAFIITAILLYVIFKSGNGDNKEVTNKSSATDNTVVVSTVGKEEKNIESNESVAQMSTAETNNMAEPAETPSEVTTNSGDNNQLIINSQELSSGVVYSSIINNITVDNGVYAIEMDGVDGPYYVNKTDFENVKNGDLYLFDDFEYYCIAITEEGYWYACLPEATLDDWETYDDIILVKTTENIDGKYPVYYKTVYSVDPNRAWQKQIQIIDEKIQFTCSKDCYVKYNNDKKALSEMDIVQMLEMVADFEVDENGNILYLEVFEPAG